MQQSTNVITLQVDSATVIRARRFVKVGAEGKAVEADAGDDAIGISQEESKNGDTAGIGVSLLSGSREQVEAGAAIDVSAGVKTVASDADGRAVESAATNVELGYAMHSVAAAGEEVEILTLRGAKVKA